MAENELRQRKATKKQAAVNDDPSTIDDDNSNDSNKTSIRDQTPKRNESKYCIDLRAAALFRVALSFVLLGDLILNWMPYTHDLFSEQGAVPWRSVRDFDIFWSLHRTIDFEIWTTFLFWLQILFALAIAVGYFTSFSCVVSWVLLTSLHNRVPAAVGYGDHLLRTMLLWSCLLPLGHLYSVDAKINFIRTGMDRQQQLVKRTRYSGIAVALFMVQLLDFYFSLSLRRSRDAAWQDGSVGVEMTFFDILAKPQLKRFSSVPELCASATRMVYYLECIGPAALWLTTTRFLHLNFRLLLCVLFIAYHLCSSVFLALGNAPMVCALLWLLWLPSPIFDLFSRRAQSSVLKLCFVPTSVSAVDAPLASLFFATMLMQPDDCVQVADEIQWKHLEKLGKSWIFIEQKPKEEIMLNIDNAKSIFNLAMQSSPITGPFSSVIVLLAKLVPFTFLWKLLSFPVFLVGGFAFFPRFPPSLHGTKTDAADFEIRMRYIQQQMRLQRPVSPIRTMITAIGIFAVIWLFLAEINVLPDPSYPFNVVVGGFGLQPTWRTFPVQDNGHPLDDGWYAAIGSFNVTNPTTNATLVKTVNIWPWVESNLQDNEEMNFAKPTDVIAAYGGTRWATFLTNIRPRSASLQLGYFGKWVCRQYEHDALHMIDFFFVREVLKDGMEVRLPPVRHWWVSC